jgi:hypothetical protein
MAFLKLLVKWLDVVLSMDWEEKRKWEEIVGVYKLMG